MGSPLSIVVFGVSNLEETTAFYRDVIGLDASDESLWSGANFEALWQLPKGAAAKVRLFSLGGSPVGRILALEFDAPDRKIVDDTDERTFRAFWNINFYVDDIETAVAHLKKHNCRIWSEPFEYEMDQGVGSWMESVAIAPDNITVVLLQLPKDEDTQTGLISEGSRETRTRFGFSQVATSSHSVSSYGKAYVFYRNVLGMEPIFEEIMADPALNKLNSRPSDGKTRWAFLQGDDNYLGKVIISHPMNYTVPDRTKVAVPPNIGYLAQSFIVPDIKRAVEDCNRLGAEVLSETLAIDIPAIGQVNAVTVLNPGSDGLTLLFTE
ncbi:MAG: hypothetical protein GKS03_02380 [Alphaproteobacteria bacterium]|nr:hypothetical protein [Alphaproteobacteria bacterium]